MKIVQKVLVRSNSKPEDFPYRRWLQDEPFLIVTVMNIK